MGDDYDTTGRTLLTTCSQPHQYRGEDHEQQGDTGRHGVIGIEIEIPILVPEIALTFFIKGYWGIRCRSFLLAIVRVGQELEFLGE